MLRYYLTVILAGPSIVALSSYLAFGERAGFSLVPHYPDPRIGGCFAWVDCWVRYARLPKIRLWYSADEEPQVGDLVVFQPEEACALHMGIVLSVSENALETAEGDYHNHSAVVERPRDGRIFGYIRLK